MDPVAIRAMPLPGSAETMGPADAAWVDASRAALQQGPMQVQVLSASIPSVKTKSSPTKTVAPPEHLYIRLRTHHAEAAGEFTTTRTQGPSHSSERTRPTLKDNTGRVYQPRDIQEVAAADNKRKSALFPVSVHDEVLVFEAPPSGVESLHLELPAEAWGRKGAFRFTIPGSMIEDKRSSPAGSTARR